MGVFLVVRYGQQDDTVYQVLHTLLTAWGWFVKSAPTLIVATTLMDLLHVDFTSIEMTL